jgi:hypothetical protein
MSERDLKDNKVKTLYDKEKCCSEKVEGGGPRGAGEEIRGRLEEWIKHCHPEKNDVFSKRKGNARLESEECFESEDTDSGGGRGLQFP